MKFPYVYAIFYFISNIEYIAAIKCNGFADLCKLDITQVTLAGTHNSGAGSNSHLNYHTPLGRVKAISCFYRNQGDRFENQLKLGIRYFDIDACWQDTYEPKGAWICHKDAYANSVQRMINDIDKWMNEPANRNEVVVIHFNRDSADADSDKTGADIIKQLKEKWEPNSKRTNAKELSIQPSMNTKLADAIKANQRIYVISHWKLVSDFQRYPWIIGYWNVGYTWTSMKYLNSNGCYALIRAMGEDRCSKEAYHAFVRYDLYLTSGLCVHDLASKCRRYINEGVQECFKGTSKSKSTVNFIVVDYADNEVIKATRSQNIQNIKLYLGKDVY